MTVTGDNLGFQYPLRAASMANAKGEDYSVKGEIRDRALEDYLSELQATIADHEARIVALEP